MKEQKLSSSETSVKLAKLAKLLNEAEIIYEEFDVSPTTDLEKLYTENGVEGTETGKGPYSYTQLYVEVFKQHVNFLRSVFMEYSKRTMENRIEFISFTLDSGEYVIFEGEEDKVTLPMPHGVTSAHTHPGICLFSSPDLETADSLFIKGYLSIGVMNPECALLLYRNGPYTIEDREALLNLMKKVRKSKTMEELNLVYTSFNSQNLSLSFIRF
ncbi:MAG: hypothetical protein QXR57_03040 [Metallosphaera sp.]|uniref:Uncharacterized protein n=1 Tax=Metallosphaera cuprina (strain Ar-4) TaxID=1006006 RepID=F4FZB6_METCR|nr:hypothetical protein [Metallosphaera cuprina]AEB94425.1 conserved hypothetical protein [Metallosphaera cuprina Ar-4]